MKDFFRKFLVALKRKPQTIPLVLMVVTFLIYSLNLTYVSNTTAKIQGPNMGLCGFITMLFSMLSILCCMNAFPARKPVNRPMWILMFVMIAIVFVADTMYLNAIVAAINAPVNPIAVTLDTVYIVYAAYYIGLHRTFLIICVVVTLLLPVYSKMIRKINTSIDIEDNGEMAAIDISAD
ncbi:MAG: hypothetical protein Q4E57_01570 [Eubacteriales bacterium]|nr:hypothetical protein [Eubacteriales bacterium]